MKTHAAIAALSALALASACSPIAKPDPDPTQTVASLADSIRGAGFVPLAIPRDDFEPGTIVEMIDTPDGGRTIERYSNMATCGATAEEMQMSSGGSVGFGSNRELRLGAGIASSIGPASLGASADYVNGARIRVGQSATPSLDRIRVEQWRERITSQYDGLDLPAVCREIADGRRKTLFIIYESLAMQNGTITYEIKRGAEAEFKNTIASVANADAGIGFDGDSSITFEGPLYFGVKRLKNLSVAEQEAPAIAPTAPAADGTQVAGATTPPATRSLRRSSETGPSAPYTPGEDLSLSEIESLLGGATF